MSVIPSTKGQDGEIKVALEISSLDRSTYHAFHNITVEAEDGTSQIDHVIISKFGVFVVETKNYAGWIFGGERQSAWTYILGQRKHRFQNPLRQNYRHIKVLSSLLGLAEDKFYSVVAFCGNSEFRTAMPSNVMASGYASYIRGKTANLISDSEVPLLVEKLNKLMLARGEETNQKHLESLRQRHGLANDSGSSRAYKGRKDSHHGLFARRPVTWKRNSSFVAAVLAAGVMVLAAFVLLPSQIKKVEALQTTKAQPTKPVPPQYGSSSSAIEKPVVAQPEKTEPLASPVADAALKEAAWRRWYKKPVECESLTDRNVVDCSNQYIVAKREFERLYAAGKAR